MKTSNKIPQNENPTAWGVLENISTKMKPIIKIKHLHNKKTP